MSKVPVQQVATVPTSNAPPTWEWAKPSWYVLYLDALQASPDLSEADAMLLTQTFEARKITLPCAECRGHYADDWATTPFTLEHARSTELATAWVQALKERVDARVAAERAAEAAKAPAEATKPRVVSRFGNRTPTVSAMRAVVTARVASSRNATPALQGIAVRTALQNTAANRSGIIRGCRTCGSTRK